MVDRSALDAAKHTLFSGDGLSAANFKMFPGSSRDATPEQIAEEITRAIAQIEAGDFEDMADDPQD